MNELGDLVGPPGKGGTGNGPGANKVSYSGIASLNTSVRDKKNLLEIRLERNDVGVNFNLNQTELDFLLTRLGIDSSHFTGVSCCPEGKGVVYVTLHPTVNIQRFLCKSECFVLKPGIRTGIIRPAGKKELSVTISGLHPNTKDQAVIKYLSAHGKVSTTDKVIHHVYPGAVGSSLCAGKLNGNRTYMVEITKPMGSYHIIDGEKVSVKYRGQDKTCARCHKTESNCPGKAKAKDCTSDRVLLSTHMQEHWGKVGYKPDTQELNDVDDFGVQIGRKEPELPPHDSCRPDYSDKYNSVYINGFPKATEIKDIYDVLKDGGLPEDYGMLQIKKNEKNGQLFIENIGSTICMSLTNHINGQKFFDNKVFVTPVVENSPKKDNEKSSDGSGSDTSDESESESDDPSTATKPPNKKLLPSITEVGKRPAQASPEESSETKKKEKKKKTSKNYTGAIRKTARHGAGQNSNKS